MDYCVYLTTYLGVKLPPLYIGSGTKAKIDDGYKGTVTSRQYGDIWKQELKDSPHLFHVKILSEHETREDAYEEEGRLQRELNVIRSPLYINMAYASRDSGFTCINQSGEFNSFSGREHDQEWKDRMSVLMTGRKCPKTPEQVEKHRVAMSGRTLSEEHKAKIKASQSGINHAQFGIAKSQSTKDKIAQAKIGRKWWTNGITSKASHDCPGDGWMLGRKVKE